MVLPLQIRLNDGPTRLTASAVPYGVAVKQVLEFAFVRENEDGTVYALSPYEEFARGCRSAACIPQRGGGSNPNGGGSGPGGDGSRNAGHVGTILPSSKAGGDPHGRTRAMERSSASDEFWNDTLVKSANASGCTKGAKTGDDVVEQFTANTKKLYEVMDKHGNAVTQEIIGNAGLWYPAAGAIAAERAGPAGMRVETSVAVLSALSPGHDWDSNIREHEIVMSVITRNEPVQGAAVGAVMKSIFEGQLSSAKSEKQKANSLAKIAEVDDMMKQADGKPFNSLSPELRARILKAHAIVTGESFEMQKWVMGKDGVAHVDGMRYTMSGDVRKINFQTENTWKKIFKLTDADAAHKADPSPEKAAQHSQALSEALGAGAKVRSFNNNIGSPNSDSRDATVDTHATSVVVGRRVSISSPEYSAMSGGASSGGDGLKGPYIAAVMAYRNTADGRGILPRQAQSETWMGQKGINDFLDGSPATSQIRSVLSNPKKAAKLSPEAQKYWEEELRIRDSFGQMVTSAREAGYDIS